MAENRELFSNLFFLKTVRPILLRAVFGWGFRGNQKGETWFISSCPQPPKTTRRAHSTSFPMAHGGFHSGHNLSCGKAIPGEGAGEFKGVTHVPRLCIFWELFRAGSRLCPTLQAVFLPHPHTCTADGELCVQQPRMCPWGPALPAQLLLPAQAGLISSCHD